MNKTPSTMTMQVAARIVALRRKRGLSQAEVAEKSGIHRITLTRIESGQHAPTVGTLAKLAEALHARLHIDLTERPIRPTRRGTHGQR
jgi:transcriptional regulator with XRE-family HTH domain